MTASSLLHLVLIPSNYLNRILVAAKYTCIFRQTLDTVCFRICSIQPPTWPKCQGCRLVCHLQQPVGIAVLRMFEWHIHLSKILYTVAIYDAIRRFLCKLGDNLPAVWQIPACVRMTDKGTVSFIH
eukprot:jgi/Picsp_1/4369/NSC_01875-R1_---NA---